MLLVLCLAPQAFDIRRYDAIMTKLSLFYVLGVHCTGMIDNYSFTAYNAKQRDVAGLAGVSCAIHGSPLQYRDYFCTRPCTKRKGKETYSSLQAKPAITATGTHIPYGITQCYLPPGRGDIPAFTLSEAGTRFSDPGGMQGWVDLGGWLEMVYP